MIDVVHMLGLPITGQQRCDSPTPPCFSGSADRVMTFSATLSMSQTLALRRLFADPLDDSQGRLQCRAKQHDAVLHHVVHQRSDHDQAADGHWSALGHLFKGWWLSAQHGSLFNSASCVPDRGYRSVRRTRWQCTRLRPIRSLLWVFHASCPAEPRRPTIFTREKGGSKLSLTASTALNEPGSL